MLESLPRGSLIDSACHSKGVERLGEETHDLGRGLPGLELHLDGIDDGDELTLAVEAEANDGSLDGLRHSEGFSVPPGDIVQAVVFSCHGSSLPGRLRATAPRRGMGAER